MKMLSTIIFLFISLTALGQEYRDQLDEVVVIQNHIVENSFITTNKELTTTSKLKIRKQIKVAQESNDVLQLSTDSTIVKISKETYLKMIRKSANRSEDHKQFLDQLSRELPLLEESICNDRSFIELYQVVRPQTMNGKLDTLPSVL